MSLCRSELDTRGLDQKQTTLEQLWSNSRMAQTRKRNRSNDLD